MDFKTLDIKASYDKNNPGVNVLNDFYIPVLGESVQYDRIGSYFRSSVFIANAKGVAAFIANGGVIRLIGDVTLLKDDVEAIKRGEDGSISDTQIEEYFKNGISRIKEKIYHDRFEFLSFLIASNRLKIRIAVVEDSNEHSKVGIFKDINENKITFLGSINESLTGWGPQGNVLEIFFSWNESDRVGRHVDTFDRMWDNQGQITKVYTFPKAVKDDLIKSISFDLKDENATRKYLRKKIEDEKKSNFPRNSIKKPHFPISYEKRTYQTNAVDNWQKANFRGFFEMATGTGKTITSLRAACRLIDKKDNLFTLILVPSTSLVNQWEKDCNLFSFKNVLKVYGENKNWYDDQLR